MLDQDRDLKNSIDTVRGEEMIERKIDLRVEDADAVYVGSDFGDLRHNTLPRRKESHGFSPGIKHEGRCDRIGAGAWPTCAKNKVRQPRGDTEPIPALEEYPFWN